MSKLTREIVTNVARGRARRRWHLATPVVVTLAHYGVSLSFLACCYQTFVDGYIPGNWDSPFAIYMHVFELPMSSETFVPANRHSMLTSRDLFASDALINAVLRGIACGLIMALCIAVELAASALRREPAPE
jgi:hypothetical protein